MPRFNCPPLRPNIECVFVEFTDDGMTVVMGLFLLLLLDATSKILLVNRLRPELDLFYDFEKEDREINSFYFRKSFFF